MRVEIAADPRAHEFSICLTVRRDAPAPWLFRMPAWLRGSYLIRDFAKHVVGLRVQVDGVDQPLRRLDKSTFAVDAAGHEIVLRYRVYAYDESVRKAYVDQRRGFFNASSLVYCPQGFEREAFELHLHCPEGCPDWRVATALPGLALDDRGFGIYRAPDYETLIDSPVEMSAFQRIDFEAGRVPHTLVLSGRCEVDSARLAHDLGRVCAAQRALFDDEPAMPRYWFLTLVTASGYGGLEHRESTALVCSRQDLPPPGSTGTSKEYRTFLGLCSHEYFHLWNVKRITPQPFADSDLSAPAYSRDLWHYEGVTSYYDDLFLLRAGLIEAPVYLDLLAEAATRLERSPARQAHTLADASFETWIKYYQPDENSPNASTNYYVKGGLVALCLDLRLRRDSAISLDTVMRALWQQYGRESRPAPEGALEAMAGTLSGLDLRSFFDAALRGCDELPLAELLADFGVQAQRRAALSESDAGGRGSGAALTRTLGCKLRPDGSVAHVLTGSPAQQVGLAAGDLLVALDGWRLNNANFCRRVETLKAGQPVPLLWFRGEELMTAAITPVSAPADTWTLTLAESPDPVVAARRKSWLTV